jgi:hypothetical protein
MLAIRDRHTYCTSYGVPSAVDSKHNTQVTHDFAFVLPEGNQSGFWWEVWRYREEEGRVDLEDC